MSVIKRAFGVMALLLCLAGPASAATITFDSFPVGPFAGGVESGFTITATDAFVWDPIFGFPTPSVGSASANTLSTYSFATTGQFQFTGLELVLPGLGGLPGPVTAQGFVGAVLVGTDVFAVPGTAQTPMAYGAVNLLGLNIDRLVLSTTSNDTQTTLIDNVGVNPLAVPEPVSLALLVTGACGLALRRARRA
jgi:hypothetical protein